jgi:PAT family beta-lactamase induction signal transducer AmpG
MRSTETPVTQPSLIEAIWNPRMLICIAVGFSSGLPLYFLLQLVQIWLRRNGVDLVTIGLIGLAQLPYAWKFLWAPLCDRWGFSPFGRRRTWMLGSQILLLLTMASIGFFSPTPSFTVTAFGGAAIVIGIFSGTLSRLILLSVSVLGIGLLSPAYSITAIVITAIAIGFFSATQDIAIDAYRREILPDHELGLGNSFYVNAYRIAGLVPGGLSLVLADYIPWSMVFVITAAFMIPGIVCTILVSEPTAHSSAPKTLRAAVIEPFHEFFTRDSIGSAVLILSFMFLYKFGDNLATAQISSFYADVGFSNTEIGAVAKLVGFWSMIIGGFVGGLIIVRIGINRSLWLFGVVQLVSIFGFALLNEVGKDLYFLGLAVGFEYLGVGLGTAAFVAFIASQANKNFSASQLALFSSFFAIPRAFTGVISGLIISEKAGLGLGWTNFFLISAATALPGMLLLYWVAPWNGKTSLN